MIKLKKAFPITISVQKSKKRVLFILKWQPGPAKNFFWRCYKKSYRLLKSYGHVFQRRLNAMKRALRKIYCDVVKVFENFFSEIGDKQLEILNDLREYKQELAIILHEEYTCLRKKVRVYILRIPRKIIIFQKYANKQIRISYKKSCRLMRSWSIVSQRWFSSYKKFLINRYADKLIIFYKQLISRVVEYIRLASQNVFGHISRYDISFSIKPRYLTFLKKLTAITLNVTVILMTIAPALYFLAIPNVALAAQFGRPDSTIDAASWVAVGAGTLHEATDETAANDDTDYASSTVATNIAELGLSNVTDPQTNTGHIVRVRFKPPSNGGGPAERLVVDLFQGAALIRSSGNLTGTRGSYGDSSFTLTAVEADNITDYNDLRLKIDTPNLGAGEEMRVTWLEFEVPNAPAEITISGTLYSDEGTSQITSGGVTIKLAVGTSTPGVFSTTTDSGSGVWQITNISEPAIGNPIAVWVDGDTNTRAFAITKASTTSNNITNFDLYQNRIITKHEGTSGTSTTNGDLAFFDNDDDADIQFTAVDGGALTILKDQELHVWTGDTFAPGGTITVHGNASSTTDGSLHIDNNATLTAGGAISVAGNWDADTGSTFTEGGNTVTFNATTTGKTIAGTLTGSNAFGNVTFNDSLGAWSFSNNASTTDFTITAGTVTAPSFLTIGGNYTNNGDFTDNGGTVFFDITSPSTITLSGQMTGTTDDFANVEFLGSGTKTFNANASTTNFTIDSGSGAVVAPSLLTMSGDYTNNGDFTDNGGTIFFNCDGACGGNTLSGQMTGTADDFNNVEFIDDFGGGITFNADASTTDFTIISGTLTAPSGLLSISGNYTNNGTFTHNSGTTTLNGTSAQTFSGTMTSPSAFNNLEITNSSATTTFSSAVSASSTLTAITPSSIVVFPASATSTFINIDLDGQAVGTRVTLRSSSAGTSWGLESSGTRSVLNTDVADSNACSGNPNIDATDSSNFDAGGNTCWDFPAPPSITVSGTLYSDEGITQITGGGAVIHLAVATATPGVFATTTDSGSGIWKIENILESDMAVGLPISVWIDGDSTTRAFTLTKASSTSNDITGVDLYQNRLITKHEGTSGTSTTNGDLAFFDNDNDSDIQFTAVDGGALTIFKDQELHVWDGDTFAPGGSITIHGNAFSTTDGSLHIDDNATLTAGGAISVAGNWDADTGSTFTEGGNTVTFNATTTGKTIVGTLTGSSAFGNVVFDGIFAGSDTWTFSNNASTTDFTITSGSVVAPSLLTIAGNYTNNSGFKDNSGTVFFTGSGITLSGQMTGTNDDFNNVEFLGAGTKTFNADASTADFTINSSSGAVVAPSLLTIGGDYTNNGDFTDNGGTVRFSSGSSIALSGQMTGTADDFNIIEFTGAGTKTFNANASTTDFTISSFGSGEVVAPSGLLSISGNYTNDGTFTHNSGTTTLNGTSPQTLSGTMISPSAFNNLEITNSSGTNAQTDPSIIFSSAVSASSTLTAITADTKLRFLVSATSTLVNIDLDGQAVGTRVTLRSSTVGAPWGLESSGTRSVLNTNIADSNACSGNPNIDAANSSNFDAGGNTCWDFPAASTITVSGTLYSDEGTSQITSGGVTINLTVATATPGIFATTTDSGSGIWKIENILESDMAIGLPISVWIEGDANTRAFTLTKASTTANDIPGVDLYQSRLIVKHEGTSGTSTTIADLALFDSNDDSDIQFTANGGSLSVFKDQELHVWDGDTFAPGGAVTIHGNASSTTDGSLHIDNNATLTTGGAISVAGNWAADAGSTFTEGGNTVTFNATTTGKTIAGTLTGSNAFGNLTFNGSGGAWSFSNNASTTDFTITAGTVTAPSSLFSISGNYTNNGTFTHNSGTTTLNGTSVQTLSGTMTSPSAFNNLEITNGSATTTFSAAVSASSTFTAITPSSILVFSASATSTLTNINLNGQALGTKVTLRSSTAGTPWGLESSGTRSVFNINVADSNACSGNPNIDATDSSNTDSGGNTCWDFPTEPAPEPEPEPEPTPSGEGGILFQPPKPEALVPFEEAEKIEQIREQLEEIKAEAERIQKVLRELAPPVPVPLAPPPAIPPVPSVPPVSPEIIEPIPPPVPVEVPRRPILRSTVEFFTQMTENVRKAIHTIGQNVRQTVKAIGQTIGQAIDIGQQVTKKTFRAVAHAVKTTLKFTKGLITHIPQFVSDILPGREVPPTIPTETFVFRSGELELVARKDEPIQTIASFRFKAEIKPSKPALQITDTFSYSDPDNDGIWTAEVEMPRILGRFSLNATIAYEDGESKEIKIAILIDPEGYVYEQTPRGELRVVNAKVTLWQKEGELSIVWPAERYNQVNPQITDRTGQYSFLTPPGEYYLEITADNYKSFMSESFILTEIAPAHQNIELQYLGETL